MLSRARYWGLLRVLDGPTKEAIPWVQVTLTEAPPRYGDQRGFVEIFSPVTSESRFTVYAMGYLPATIKAPRHGTTDTILLQHAPPAGSSLRGTWTLAFTLEQADIGSFTPSDSSARGTITFDSSSYRSSVRITEEFGRFKVPWNSMLGGPIAPDASTSYYGPSAGIHEEASGGIFSLDSVYIGLIPRVTHGGLTLRGKRTGDLITGIWTLNGNYSSACGTFRMELRRNE